VTKELKVEGLDFGIKLLGERNKFMT